VISSFNFGKATKANGGKASFALDQAATVVITVTKKGSDKALQTINLTGKEGTNKLKGLGKGLAKGKYYVRIKATDSGGQVRNKKFTFRVSG
jgi:hypothetical protein